jgi:hypothetical protein
LYEAGKRAFGSRGMIFPEKHQLARFSMLDLDASLAADRAAVAALPAHRPRQRGLCLAVEKWSPSKSW